MSVMIMVMHIEVQIPGARNTGWIQGLMLVNAWSIIIVRVC